MNQMTPPTQEELEKLLEKAKRDLEAKLAQMTLEERAQAEARALQIISDDRAANQELIDRAAQYMTGSPAKPKFCTNCGSPL